MYKTRATKLQDSYDEWQHNTDACAKTYMVQWVLSVQRQERWQKKRRVQNIHEGALKQRNQQTKLNAKYKTLQIVRWKLLQLTINITIISCPCVDCNCFWCFLFTQSLMALLAALSEMCHLGSSLIMICSNLFSKLICNFIPTVPLCPGTRISCILAYTANLIFFLIFSLDIYSKPNSLSAINCLPLRLFSGLVKYSDIVLAAFGFTVWSSPGNNLL
jgi:hypothetical protein